MNQTNEKHEPNADDKQVLGTVYTIDIFHTIDIFPNNHKYEVQWIYRKNNIDIATWFGRYSQLIDETGRIVTPTHWRYCA